MRGFIVSDHPDLFGAGREELAGLLRDGRLRHEETIVDGFEQLPAALHRLFSGESTGKVLVRVAEPAPA
jgi:NADPH-dependent curcumin reductase CurA